MQTLTELNQEGRGDKRRRENFKLILKRFQRRKHVH